MTDNEIIKALECCIAKSGKGCSECPYHQYYEECRTKRNIDCVDLINRQKAEIERLSRPCFVLNRNPLSDKERKELEKCPTGVIPVNGGEYTIKRIDEEGIRAEAIKEFAERLKKRIGDSHFQNYGLAILEIIELVEEMTEVDNDV